MRKFILPLVGLLFLGLLLSAKCSNSSTTTKTPGKSDAPIVNTRWVLKKLGDTPITLGESGKDIYFTLMQDSNRMHGFAGCNNINGTYVVDNDQKTISFSKIMSTFMACDILDTESKFIKMLEGANSYQISGDDMSLLTDGQVVATFAAVYL